MSDGTGRQLSVAFRTLGCKVNRVESDEIAVELLGRGAVIVPEEEARVVVVNTCTVTGEADTKARKAVRQALRSATEPVVVVTGCLAALDREGLEALGPRVVVCSEKSAVAARVAEALELTQTAPVHARVAPAGDGFRTRAMLKIEDGCDNGCAYCIIPSARGVPTSVGHREVLERAERLVEAGAREIVVTGINIGRYSDEVRGVGLPGLLADLARSGVERIRLSSIEPPDLTDELIGVLASSRAFCPHLHVPLQSGSDRVLEAMKRNYNVQSYVERIDAARAAIPGLAVTTDVIAGLPTETDDDLAETVATCEAVGFARMHVFRYSERPNTPAAVMAQVPPAMRAARARVLRDCADTLAKRYAELRAGHRATVLVESRSGTVCVGTTEDYLRARFDSAETREGDLVDVVLGALSGDSIDAVAAGPR
jgi:threonylcarbamoyladenosine tRNA methylthiotransferase MtaB